MTLEAVATPLGSSVDDDGIVQVQDGQVASERKEIALIDVDKAKVAHAHGLFEFRAGQGQGAAVAAAGVAKDVPAQATVVAALAVRKGLFAVGTLGPEGVHDRLDLEFEDGHGVGEIDVRVGGGLRVVGGFLLVGTMTVLLLVLLTAGQNARHGGTGVSGSRWGSHSGAQRLCSTRIIVSRSGG